MVYVGLEEKLLEELEEGPRRYAYLKKYGRSGEVSAVLHELRNRGLVYPFVAPDGYLCYARRRGLSKLFAKIKKAYLEFLERGKYPEQTGLESLLISGVDPILAYNTFRRSNFQMSKAFPFTVEYDLEGGARGRETVYVCEEFMGTRKGKDVEVVVRYGFDERSLERVLRIDINFYRLPGEYDRVVQKDRYLKRIGESIGPTLKARTYALRIAERTISTTVLTSKLLYEVLAEVWYRNPKGWLSQFLLELITDEELGIGKNRTKTAEFIVALLYRLGEIKIEKRKLSSESLYLTRR